MQSPPFPSYLVPPRSNILLNTMFSNTISFLSSRNVNDQVSHPYKTIGKIIEFYNISHINHNIFTLYLYVIYRLKHKFCISQIDEISIRSGLHVSAVKHPSSGQCRTYTRYNIEGIEYTLILYLLYVLHWADDGCFTAETWRPDVINISAMC